MGTDVFLDFSTRGVFFFFFKRMVRIRAMAWFSQLWRGVVVIVHLRKTL